MKKDNKDRLIPINRIIDYFGKISVKVLREENM